MNNDRHAAPVKDATAKPAADAKGAKAPDAHAKRPTGERASLPGERAESEGMIAPPSTDAGVEGEGSYTATRHYDEGVARSVAAGKTEELANKAARALDGPEGAELRAAEKAAKQGHSR
ncbi:MAG: hypothetical protein ABJE95_09425 [Byssovorax sp.]